MMNCKCFYFKLNLLAFFLFSACLTYGQQSLNIIDLYYESFLSTSARSIQEKASVGAYSFHGRIGGISFESVAIPSKAVGNSTVSLDYEADRFVITINDKKIYPELPDWQLIPTVKFADSPYHVLFSPLGDTVRNRQAQCRYHPAFLNTLAGLRVFEADLLNLPDLLWDLPKNPEGEYILARSEKEYVPERNDLIEQKLYDDLCGDVRPFTSFVLTDRNANIGFDVKNNKLHFIGHPYYLFTKDESDMEHMDSLRKEVEQTYIDIEKTLNASPIRDAVDAINRLDSLDRLSDEEIGIKLSILNRYSTAFNQNWERLKQYNLPVYSTIENIARWAAFFRYVKQTNPAGWNGFVRKVGGRTVKDAPKVHTPTSYDVNYFRLIEENGIMETAE